MRGVRAWITELLCDEQGPTTVEYAMLGLLVLLACLTAITLIGQATATKLPT